MVWCCELWCLKCINTSFYLHIHAQNYIHFGCFVVGLDTQRREVCVILRAKYLLIISTIIYIRVPVVYTTAQCHDMHIYKYSFHIICTQQSMYIINTLLTQEPSLKWEITSYDLVPLLLFVIQQTHCWKETYLGSYITVTWEQRSKVLHGSRHRRAGCMVLWWRSVLVYLSCLVYVTIVPP
jgi:hypothetical protein